MTYKLIQGDSSVICPTLENESLGLVVTSPPYFAMVPYDTPEGNLESEESWGDYCQRLVGIFTTLYDKLAPGGRLCINIDDKYTSYKETGVNKCLHTHAILIVSLTKAGYDFKGDIIWKKIRGSHASGGANRILGTFPYPPEIPIITQYEHILVFRKPGQRKSSNRTDSLIPTDIFKTLATGVWEINGKDDKHHPAVFPVAIPYRLIALFSFREDTVLDPFNGVGTTGVAAIRLGRDYIGIDLSDQYLRESERRLARADPDPIYHARDYPQDVKII